MLITTLFVLVDSLQTSVSDSLDFLEGTVIIQEKGVPDPSFSRIPNSVVNELEQANRTTLHGILQGISPRIAITERDNSSTLGIKQAIGIIPSQEKETTNILQDSNILIGRSLYDNDKNKVVIGILAATAFNMGLNDKIPIKNETFTVIGIFQTNSLVDAIMYIPFKDAQRITNMTTEVSAIFVRCKNLINIKDLKNYVNNELSQKYDVEAVDFQELASQGLLILEIVNQFGYVVGFLTMIVATLSVVNTVLMGVHERTREIAVLKATGWTNKEIGLEVIIESLVITFTGGILGIFLGVWVSKLTLSISATLLTFSFSWKPILQSSSITILLGFLAGLYPAYRAMAVSPVTDLAR